MLYEIDAARQARMLTITLTGKEELRARALAAKCHVSPLTYCHQVLADWLAENRPDKLDPLRFDARLPDPMPDHAPGFSAGNRGKHKKKRLTL